MSVHQFSQQQRPEAATMLQSARASSFKMSAIQWLWPNRFALGKLGLLAGLPDEGKGQVFCNMAATVSIGGPWPCGEGSAPKGNVVLLTAEDDFGDTVIPRLRAAGADVENIEIVSMVRDKNRKRMFSLATDLELLRNKIVQVGNVKLVQIDPLSAYLGNAKMDTFRTSDVRSVLAPLVDLAAELKVSVVGMMHFNKRLDVDNALLRISDSLAFGATARHVYAVVDDAENKRKLVVKAKNNLSSDAHDRALAYRFGVREVGIDEETAEIISAPYILWEKDHVDMSATEAMQQAANKSSSARDEAKRFLADMLAAGPVLKSEIEEAAGANGIKDRTLFRAKDELGITAKKDGPNGGWRWHMPTPKAASS